MLYRVFRYTAGRPARPLAVPRSRQGAGRHDNPTEYTAIYLSREAVSAVAEVIQAFRGRAITDRDLTRADGSVMALAPVDDSIDAAEILDLDDPAVLLAGAWRPSRVATGERPVTQKLALEVFQRGAVGCSWWSTLEASWTNVTLFGERVGGKLTPVGSLEPLTVKHPAVIAAAARLGVDLGRR